MCTCTLSICSSESLSFKFYCSCVQIILIQKYYRRWLAKRYVNKLKEDKRKRLEWERLEEIRKQKEKEERIKREFERRMQPKTKEDFDLLYAALESEFDVICSILVSVWKCCLNLAVGGLGRWCCLPSGVEINVWCSLGPASPASGEEAVQWPGSPQSSGAVWKSRWPSWTFLPNEPYGFRGHKAILKRASALVTIYP